MFDKILGRENSEEKAMRQAEERQNEQVRARDAFVAAQTDGDHVTPQELRGDIIRWQQDLSDEIETLKRRLRGEHWNGADWKKRSKEVEIDGVLYNVENKPLANDLFIEYVETQVEPFLSRNLINSNLTEKRILQILKDTMNDISDAMSDGWDIYDIDFTNYDIILRLIKNTITPAAFRALMGWTKKQDSTTIKRIETQQESFNAQNQKKGIAAVFQN